MVVVADIPDAAYSLHVAVTHNHPGTLQGCTRMPLPGGIVRTANPINTQGW